MYIKALQIAFNAHKGQVRRGSLAPYIVHPMRVSGYFSDDFRKTIAVLHDVVEDTDITLDDIELEFSKGVASVIDSLSRRKGEVHLDYVRRVSKDEIATQIKIADITDNLSDAICVHSESMLKRYNDSLEILLNK